jgi:hypothetical protein
MYANRAQQGNCGIPYQGRSERDHQRWLAQFTHTVHHPILGNGRAKTDSQLRGRGLARVGLLIDII